MKIALMVDDIIRLESWQFRIVKHILNSPNLNLSLIIENKNGKKQRSNLFFKMQEKIEKRLFKIKSNQKFDNIISSLILIDKITIKPVQNKYFDSFEEEYIKKISSYNIDLIVKFGFNNLSGDILSVAKLGIWSINFSNYSLDKSYFAGFWNIVNKTATVKVKLLRHSKEKLELVDCANFNTSWIFTKLRVEIQEGVVPLFIKNIELLNQNIISYKDFNKQHISYKAPSTVDTLKYLFMFYFNLFKRLYKRVDSTISGSRFDCWRLFLGKDNFFEQDFKNIKPLELPKNEFWADPFVCEYKNENYIFFENYNYTTKLGKISCGKIADEKIVNVTDVLVKDYHLSYPFIFKENSEIFMIPETSENRRLEIYKCVEFPNSWELYSTAFEGEILFDTTLYKDNDNQLWLFTNKQSHPDAPVDSELYIYKIDSLKLNKIESHKLNPVMINAEVARGGGSIFRKNDKLYRPSQCNIDGIYGKYLNINEIIELNLNEYKEKRIKTIKPDFQPNLISIHHLDQKSGIFVIDAAYRRIK